MGMIVAGIVTINDEISAFGTFSSSNRTSTKASLPNTGSWFIKTSRFFGRGAVASGKVQVKSPLAWNTNSPPRTSITSPTGTSRRFRMVSPSLFGSGTRPLKKTEITSPDTSKLSLSMLKRSKMLPVKTTNSSPPSWVPKRCPNSVGVKAVQKPEVFDAVSERKEVVTKATKGTTQMKTIRARTICFKPRLIIVSAPSLFARAEVGVR